MRLFAIVCVLVLTVFSVPALSQGNEGSQPVQLVGLLRGTIDYVHHDKQQLVISDRRFTMPLNFKVTDTKGKSITRFGVKVGQSVEYFVRYEEKSNIFYVDRLKLLN
ncbi:hypothetical protein [Pseudoteredinibacter isoporae]|uniref:DUF5666 domain-containing protein n=1 Tax=Pseudoteredinibacter isoporae TaxID=570281 RepID=A0A7X0JRN1_9GAMM|nr:hypothetical protein [Pseudoteredinibacter isoporae]MBB6520912.1 hypothetical protein [Pseudoteredinibacter isoporae]NHO86477.1 hypothetical protein [Pseudoteredinibacter isoporae]NIB25071.1 hypothetical protein [Pseudoteredinibacter isoporae]